MQIFSLMGLRDYGYFRPLRNLFKGAMFYIPVVFPKLRQNRIVARLHEPAAGLPNGEASPLESFAA